ncbi:MAG: hypothetical protein AAFV53_00415 [Myxococcota bacterium]
MSAAHQGEHAPCRDTTILQLRIQIEELRRQLLNYQEIRRILNHPTVAPRVCAILDEEGVSYG